MELEIVFWDVQHGSATYIKTPDGKHIAIDLGTGSHKGAAKEFSPLQHLKKKYSVSRLDGVVITHPHRDHIDDILSFDLLQPHVLSRPKGLPKDEILKNAAEGEKPLYEKFFEIDARYSEPVLPANNPFDSANNGGVVFQTFFPPAGASNINDLSIVTVVSFAKSKVIIPGDNEPASWKELLKDSAFNDAIRNADILLAPHHGRDSGFCSEIFELFKPRLTVISDGRFVDTSATDRYGAVTTGWMTHRRSGSDEERRCVTTRNDGVIVVKFGCNAGGKPFIDVRID